MPLSPLIFRLQLPFGAFIWRRLLILLLVGGAATIHAQDHAFEPEEVTFTPLPAERHLELIKKLDYNPSPERRKEEEKKRVQREQQEKTASAFEKWLDNLFNSNQEIGPIELPKFLFYLIIIALIGVCGYFIFTLLDERFWGRFKREEEARRVDIEEIEEERLSFKETDSLLTRAEKNEQFAIAVRLQYLAVLKRLHEMELIRFKKDKVNRLYVSETTATPFGETFKQLTIDYERNWYGDYPIDRLSYRLIARKFTDFRSRLDHFELQADA